MRNGKRWRGYAILAGLTFIVALAVGPGNRSAHGQEDTLYLPVVIGVDDPLNLPLQWATYMGGTATDDALNVVDIAPDGTLLVGGRLAETPGGAPPATIEPGATSGAVLHVAAADGQVLSLLRLGAVVNDLEAGADGRVTTCGDFGIAALATGTPRVLWHADAGDTSRCARGDDGTAAGLTGNTVTVYDAAGVTLGSWRAGDNVRDVAVDSAAGLVFATGYTQKASDLKVPYLRAWTYDGQARWTAYDFDASALKAAGLTADAEGLRVAMGRDGWLYFAGNADGGNAIFARDPQDVSRRLSATELIKTDAYNDPYNLSGAKALAWYGRFAPATGSIDRGQWLLTRLSSGKGNSIRIHGLTAMAGGCPVISGEAYASIERRSERRVAGITVGPYAGGEPFVLTLSPDWRTRTRWSPLTAPDATGGAGSSPASAIATRDGQVVLGLTLNNGALVTHSAQQVTPGTLAEGYLAAWRTACE